MKKQVLGYILLFLITILLIGCTGTNIMQEPEITLDTAEDIKATHEVCINTTVPEVSMAPQITPFATTSVTKSPERTKEPTLKVFDVDEVLMQSTPDSSCFSEVGYDSDWKTLVVKFRDSGSVYIYLGFPVDEWNKFISAGSLGSWYNKHIKGIYKCEKAS